VLAAAVGIAGALLSPPGGGGIIRGIAGWNAAVIFWITVVTPAPTFGDFLYFSLTIGATSQTSDVVISSPAIRRAVAVHALLSFAFNTAVLAVIIKIAAGLV
jgi:hypothetical protein